MLSRLIPIFILALLLPACGESPDLSEQDIHDQETEVPVPDTSQEGKEDVPPPLSDLLEVCEPDCTDKECGGDGCGGSCGICDLNLKCIEEGVCTPVCLSGATTTCIGGAVYWVDTCGETEEIKESCSTGTQCLEGTCIPCTPNATIGCHQGARYHFDSCDNPGMLIGECAEGLTCVEGNCVSASSPYSGTFAITVDPTEVSVTLDGESWATSFAAVELEISIDAQGSATLLFKGISSQWSGIGTLTGYKVSGAFEFTQIAGEETLLHKVSLTILFTGYDSFSGTLDALVFLGDDTGIPVSAVRDISGYRIEETSLP